MIELSSTTATMLYLCVTLILVFALWGYEHYKSRKKKIIISEKELIVCEYCHYAYLIDVSKAVTQCPQCTCYNKRRKELYKKSIGEKNGIGHIDIYQATERM